MPASLIYRNAGLYEAVMVALYGRHYGSRYRAIADLIEAESSVLDLCCGPAVLYRRYLRAKAVRYTGLDVSEPFIEQLKRSNAEGFVWDLTSDRPLPSVDYVVMQASLYQFLPAAEAVVDRMLRAARKQVIVAEPIQNLTSSKSRLIAAFGRRFTDPGDGRSAHRFNEQTLTSFFEPYSPYIRQSFLIPGAREKVYVLDSNAHASDG